MIHHQNITALRMQRQFLHRKANSEEYDALYRDTQPGQNVYWNGFGNPPSITFRAAFDDIEYNRRRQLERKLVKGRFQGGNLGWIVREDLELFAGLSAKPLENKTPAQSLLFDLIEREGPLNIQMIKESTGMLVKEITPVLHRLQEAFLIYEDQYDGGWDRGWYLFSEMFPDVDIHRYSRFTALKTVLQRFAYRNVFFHTKMAKNFYKLPEKDIRAAAAALADAKILVPYENGYLLAEDAALLEAKTFPAVKSVFAMHRNDFLVKSREQELKETFQDPEYDILQFLLIDGEFRGAVLGRFKNGPYVIENIVTEIDRKQEILEAVYAVNNREYSPVRRYRGEEV